MGIYGNKLKFRRTRFLTNNFEWLYDMLLRGGDSTRTHGRPKTHANVACLRSFPIDGNRPSNFCRLPSMCSLRIGTSANLKLNLLLSSSLNTSWQARSFVTVTVSHRLIICWIQGTIYFCLVKSPSLLLVFALPGSSSLSQTAKSELLHKSLRLSVFDFDWD
jgi:hypothetical protein